MFKAILLLLCFSLSLAKDIVGYGGTFSDMFIQESIKAFEKNTGYKVKYQSIGSLGAMKQLELKKSNFAIVDINASYEDLISKPLLSGNLSISYNLEGIDRLNLTPEIIGKIYEGEIKFWDDDLIKTVNPNLSLKHDNIIIFHRYDGSGSTLNFTEFLKNSYKKWSFNPDEYINFKVGIGKKGGLGVAKAISQTINSIGYVGYPDANATGIKSANILLNENIYSVKDDNYPIKNHTYFIYPKSDKDSERFLNFIYENSDKILQNSLFKIVK